MSAEQAVNNSTKDYVLSIDNGTQSVRAMLFDAAGHLHGLSRIEIEPYVSVQPGWAEQEADYYWQAVGQACQQLWQQVSIDKAQIKGVSVTTQRGTVVHVDQQGQALRPAMVWLDQRLADVNTPLPNPWRSLFKLVGAASIVDYFRGQAEINWVAQHQPEIHALTHKVLLLSGYLNYQLSGRVVDSVASCVGYLPFDYKKLRWAAKGDWKWHALAVRG